MLSLTPPSQRNNIPASHSTDPRCAATNQFVYQSQGKPQGTSSLLSKGPLSSFHEPYVRINRHFIGVEEGEDSTAAVGLVHMAAVLIHRV